jgi:hypothetical protein
MTAIFEVEGSVFQKFLLQLQNDAQVYNTVIRIYYQALQILLVICYQDKWVKLRISL